MTLSQSVQNLFDAIQYIWWLMPGVLQALLLGFFCILALTSVIRILTRL